MFALEFEAVGGLQQPLTVIQHLLADLGQSALVGTSFKKFDAKLNLKRRYRRADCAAALAKPARRIGDGATAG
ncbi:hypothetical protein NUITMVA1_09410 [Aeromonas hydrophila]|nr:hypothetical protein NUITMVA1_09410 [Aeromonas hydrophila]